MSRAYDRPCHRLWTEMLLDLYYFNRLFLNIIQRMGLVLYLMEIDIHQVDAADIAVPCCPVVEFHRLQVCRSGELCSTWHSCRNLRSYMLASDRNVEVVQDMEGLDYCVKSVIPYRSCSLEECSSYES